MREDSRRGAPRSPRAAGRAAGMGPAARATRPGYRGGPGGAATGYGSDTPGPGGRGGGYAQVDVARLTKVIEPVLAAMQIDLEGIKLTPAGRRRVLRVIVDADGGISLDDIAEVSRELSARLDARNAMGEAPYTLEVSSPGVDRPLTQPRHWRRAIGRLVRVPLTPADPHEPDRDTPRAGAECAARVIDADQDRVTLEIDGAMRILSYGELGPGRVQVEFARLDEADDGDGPDEEGPDGH